jgi:bifunctional DNA-binding transcriptional regulator/antitoxin component of YhaV-PrlF toxin-antitoxin module
MCLYHLPDAQTKLSAKGHVVIPKDVWDDLKLKPGMRFSVVQGIGEMRLKMLDRPSDFSPTTINDFLNIPAMKSDGTAKTIEDISGLDDQTLREIFNERDGANSR